MFFLDQISCGLSWNIEPWSECQPSQSVPVQSVPFRSKPFRSAIESVPVQTVPVCTQKPIRSQNNVPVRIINVKSVPFRFLYIPDIYIYIRDVQEPERNGFYINYSYRNVVLGPDRFLCTDRNGLDRNGFNCGPERFGPERNRLDRNGLAWLTFRPRFYIPR